MPPGTFIPELGYRDVNEAAAWLARAFGFRERLRIGNHRVQLSFGDGSMVATQIAADTLPTGHAVMLRVDDIDAHHAQARDAGAKIFSAPTNFPYGERQYTAEDLCGHRWVFSQSIADVDPAAWGGKLLA